MEKTFPEVHHSLPIALARSTAGIPCVGICLSLSSKSKQGNPNA